MRKAVFLPGSDNALVHLAAPSMFRPRLHHPEHKPYRCCGFFWILRHCAIATIIGFTLWPSSIHAAEFTCATAWNLQRNDSVTKRQFEEMVARRFPSGPQPILGSSCLTGVLAGSILTGDDEQFLRFYRQHHPFLQTFLLVSPGGSVDAAISIGRLFRKYLIEAFGPVRVPSGMRRPWGDTTGRMVDWCQGRECVCAS